LLLILVRMCLQGLMMMTSGFFRPLPDLPKIFWRYPISYINYGAWGLQVKLEALPSKGHDQKDI